MTDHEDFDKEAVSSRLLYFLSLGQSPEDMILEELIESVRLMDDQLSSEYLQDMKRIMIVKNKVDLLLTIQKLIEKREYQGTHRQIIAVVALLVRNLQDVLKESGIPGDMVKVIVTNLLNKVEGEQASNPILSMHNTKTLTKRA